jgi:hypothetical protein
MKRYVTVLSVLLILGCSLAFAEDQPWSFVKAVGGLKVGAPVQSKDGWLLPIQADVSGSKAITTKPTTINSAIACKSVNARVKGQDIFLVIATTLAHGGMTSDCPAAKLGKLTSESYNVWYGTSRAKENSLGSVRVAL